MINACTRVYESSYKQYGPKVKNKEIPKEDSNNLEETYRSYKKEKDFSKIFRIKSKHCYNKVKSDNIEKFVVNNTNK